MIAVVIKAFLVLFLMGKCTESRPYDEMEHLELVHAVFRHGDRTPDKQALYKNDPYINATYYPIGFGQLTNPGKRKEYEIGKALRKRYASFLNEFTLDTVDARSTDYNRTKMSLQLVLASLFPPTGHHVWENRLDWQPVPYNYWPNIQDHVLGDALLNCPRYEKEFNNFLESHNGQKLFEKHADVIKVLEEKTGENPMKSKAFSDLYFTLTTESENGYEMPDWAQEHYETIKRLAIADYVVRTGNNELKKLVSGFLVKKMLDDTMAKIKGTHERTKIFLYSAHESNIAYLLRFLGVFYPHVPPYGAYLLIEVHNVNGIRGIKVFYQDYTSNELKRYPIPNCDDFCRIEKFLELYKDLLPYSEKECF